MTGFLAFITDLVLTAIIVPALIVRLAITFYWEREQK